MIVELLPRGGLGHGKPVRMEASQVVVRQNNGTPVMIAADYGEVGNIVVASVAHNPEEFNRTLRQLGIGMTVIVDRLQMPPPPPGARLISKS